VARLLPPESSSLDQVSREVGVSAATLERWRADALANGSGDRLEAVSAGRQQRDCRQQMTSVNGGVPGAIGDVFAVATRNAARGGDLVIATGQVMAKRMALGMAAALNPLRADHIEFARIVPEKVGAFWAAGMIMIEQSNRANRQMTRLASDEVVTTACATIAMAGCSSPAALAAVQGRFALAWFGRAASNFIAMAMLTLSAQDAAMAPIRQTVGANAERLR
jgi:hypothetical protein